MPGSSKLLRLLWDSCQTPAVLLPYIGKRLCMSYQKSPYTGYKPVSTTEASYKAILDFSGARTDAREV